MSFLELSEQEQIRRNALGELARLNIQAYPPETWEVNAKTTEILSGFSPEKNNFQEVSLAGRIMTRRIMGSASFAELQDGWGRIQLYVRREDICKDGDNMPYDVLFKKLMDIGDIIGIKGFVFVTKMGEISIHVKEIKLLSKSLKPLPVVKEKDGKTFDAFTDAEQRYRQRYVDLVVNPHVRDAFIKRTRLVNSMREFLNIRGYLEVETPILQPLYGGAAARPFN